MRLCETRTSGKRVRDSANILERNLHCRSLYVFHVSLFRCPSCSDPVKCRRSGYPEGVAVPRDPLSPSSIWKCLSCGAETDGAEAGRTIEAFDALRGKIYLDKKIKKSLQPEGARTESRNPYLRPTAEYCKERTNMVLVLTTCFGNDFFVSNHANKCPVFELSLFHWTACISQPYHNHIEPGPALF